jgi:hypothetical protein
MTATTLPFTSLEIQQTAEQNARRLGLSLREYVSRLVLRDTPPKAKHSRGSAGDKDPWGPVPKEVSQRWDREEAEFEQEDRKHPQPRFTSGRDFVAYLRRQP